jgi:hypothetical protein
VFAKGSGDGTHLGVPRVASAKRRAELHLGEEHLGVDRHRVLAERRLAGRGADAVDAASVLRACELEWELKPARWACQGRADGKVKRGGRARMGGARADAHGRRGQAGQRSARALDAPSVPRACAVT